MVHSLCRRKEDHGRDVSMSLSKRIFVTATDTDAGKTYVSSGLLEGLSNKGFCTTAFKPVASGCDMDDNGNLVNSDAEILQKQATIFTAYNLVNPFRFSEAVSPHLLGEKYCCDLTVARICSALEPGLAIESEIALIEGFGGWLAPLNRVEKVSDIAIALDASVLLVVNMRVGCLNHACLTAQSILGSNAIFAGWIANVSESNFDYLDENVAYLREQISAPCLGVVRNGEAVSDILDINLIYNTI